MVRDRCPWSSSILHQNICNSTHTEVTLKFIQHVHCSFILKTHSFSTLLKISSVYLIGNHNDVLTILYYNQYKLLESGPFVNLKNHLKGVAIGTKAEFRESYKIQLCSVYGVIRDF